MELDDDDDVWLISHSDRFIFRERDLLSTGQEAM
jgi:hypothetical protein